MNIKVDEMFFQILAIVYLEVICLANGILKHFNR